MLRLRNVQKHFPWLSSTALSGPGVTLQSVLANCGQVVSSQQLKLVLDNDPHNAILTAFQGLVTATSTLELLGSTMLLRCIQCNDAVNLKFLVEEKGLPCGYMHLHALTANHGKEVIEQVLQSFENNVVKQMFRGDLVN